MVKDGRETRKEGWYGRMKESSKFVKPSRDGPSRNKSTSRILQEREVKKEITKRDELLLLLCLQFIIKHIRFAISNNDKKALNF